MPGPEPERFRPGEKLSRIIYRIYIVSTFDDFVESHRIVLPVLIRRPVSIDIANHWAQALKLPTMPFNSAAMRFRSSALTLTCSLLVAISPEL
jgi:hypothetical protein